MAVLTEFDSYTDRQIVEKILCNDKQVIGYFFNKKCSKLLSYIVWNVFDGHVDQRELISELFIYLSKDDWHKIKQFDYRSKLMTWTGVVAFRFFQKKREMLIENLSSEALIEKNRDSETATMELERRIDIRKAISLIPNYRYQKVIEKLDLEEYMPARLADEMDITVDNLYNIHRRALLQLKLIMSRKEDYCG